MVLAAEVLHPLWVDLEQRRRLAVRPGVTGLAQVQLGADTDVASVRRKLLYDLHYVQHLNAWMDLRILVATAIYALGNLEKAGGPALPALEKLLMTTGIPAEIRETAQDAINIITGKEKLGKREQKKGEDKK